MRSPVSWTWLMILVLALLMVIFGTSCASQIEGDSSWTPADTTSYEVLLPDGRTAICVYSNGAMDCDFPPRGQ